MRDAWMQARQERRTIAVLVDLALHALVLVLVLAQVAANAGTEAVIVAGLLFPITYLVGPLVLGIAGGEWLPFLLQMAAVVGAVAIVGVPALDREQATSRGCLQLLATTVLVVILDLFLHVAALALVIERIDRSWGVEAAIAAAVLFPLTYLVGPLALAFLAADWLPLLLQLGGLGLIGLLIIASDA